MTKEELAISYFKSGYNCAQAVLLAFCEEVGIDKQTATKISSSFGGGMGRLREVCGAVSSMFLVAGYLYGDYDPLDNQAKAKHYALIQSLAQQFKDEAGSIICRELLEVKGAQNPTPEERNSEYYKKRVTCADCVGLAAKIIEKMLKEKKNEN